MQTRLDLHRVTLYPFQDNMFKEFISIDNDFEYKAKKISKKLNKKFRKKWYNMDNASDEDFTFLVEKYVDKICEMTIDDGTSFITNYSQTLDYKIEYFYRNPERDCGIDYDEPIEVVIALLTIN